MSVKVFLLSQYNIQKILFFRIIEQSIRLFFFDIEDKMTISLTAIYKKVPEGYIAFVEELPGANTQGYTIEETRKNLEEAIQMVLEANRMLAEEQTSEIFKRESYKLALV